MLRLCISLSLLIFAKSAPSNETTSTTTSSPTDPPDIYCDWFPDPSVPDEGNYGDATCYINGIPPNEKLLLRKTLVSFDGDTGFADSYEFPGTLVTRASIWNFGRYHGAVNAIDILQEQGTGKVEIYVDIFSRKGVRMFLEIWGVE